VLFFQLTEDILVRASLGGGLSQDIAELCSNQRSRRRLLSLRLTMSSLPEEEPLLDIKSRIAASSVGADSGVISTTIFTYTKGTSIGKSRTHGQNELAAALVPMLTLLSSRSSSQSDNAVGSESSRFTFAGRAPAVALSRTHSLGKAQFQLNSLVTSKQSYQSR
jgi:hypothetical protein